MRLFFYLLIIAAAMCYTTIAFVDLDFANRGRMGPGFLPRILGVSILITMLIVILGDIKNKTLFSGRQNSQYKDAFILIALSVMFGIVLAIFGYMYAIPVYIFLTLSYFNKGRLLSNSAVTVILPLVIHFLFGSLLNASLPRGLWW